MHREFFELHEDIDGYINLEPKLRGSQIRTVNSNQVSML